ncbi:MAG: MATE family efflux transporter [Oscillospiraceae bacterium]|nr:MATE family efflux transporter [Oscillospiraceae bacterium]
MNQIKENKMAVTPVPRLILQMGIPMILSMMLQAVYNIVDSAFVSNMAHGGEEAMNALTLVFPMQMLMVAVGIGTGVGAGAVVSRSLGQGDARKAGRTAGNAFFLCGVLYLVFLLFGIFGTGAYVRSQASGEADPAVLTMAVSYLRICCVMSFGILVFSITEKLLQATGHSVYSTVAQIGGAVTNIVLDPIMIYGLLGCPEMGVEGAAWATVIGQIVSAVLGLVFHLRVNREVKSRLHDLRPDMMLLREIYTIGLPAIIAQALMSLMTYGLNIILGSISPSMQTAYGLYYKIQQFILFAAFGLRDAITPVISYSHGMGSRERIRDGVRSGIVYTAVIMLIGMAAIEVFAVPFAGLFGLSGRTQALCIGAMHVVSLSFLFAGMNIAFQGIYQALGGGIESLVISLCRQLLIIFPLVLIAAHLAQADPARSALVWAAFPVTELVTMLIGIVLLRRLWARRVGELHARPVTA